MRFTLSFMLSLLLVSINVQAVDIPKGTFYFDNSKTQYNHVKFVYGSDANCETYVVSMTKESDTTWKLTMPEAAIKMYRYTFANTTLPDGKMTQSFSSVKDDISLSRKEYRTATTDATITLGYTYTPTSGNNWAQGAWMFKSDNTAPYSSTLPVLYINTEDKKPITSKEEYLTASYYLDNMGVEGYDSFGTAEAPLTLQIKGRGNYTWIGFDKKPYRLKLSASAALLNMKASKHFVLLAHADDNMAFLRNTVGFELSRLLGLPYTPAQQPVEVMLNGSYIGLYLLTENIRVDADRVNISKQADNATDAEAITGGWLVEIDNYDDPAQIKITEGNGAIIRFTYKTPEALSTEQTKYLTQQVTTMNEAIYSTNKNSTVWENHIDINTLARFYLVQELMDNAESFHGSCYLYKDKGVDQWFFGPVWDFGNSFRRGTDKFIYTDSPFGQTWIGEIAKYPRFQAEVKRLWKEFKGNQYPQLASFVDNFTNQISVAAQYDAQRWPQYGNANVSNGKNSMMSYLNRKSNWLVQQWGEGVTGFEEVMDENKIMVSSNVAGAISVCSKQKLNTIRVCNLKGEIVVEATPNATEYDTPVAPGVYIVLTTTEDGTIAHQKIWVK